MEATTAAPTTDPRDGLRWFTSLPFFAIHVAAICAFFVVEWGWREVIACVAFYYLRMFFVTAGYHRYFSHRTYKTSRVFQFLLAFMGSTCAQKGVLWWAANHRHHHKYSDEVEDIHSPLQRGFWWSHVGWILSSRHEDTHFELIRDFASYPELRWLNRFHLVPPTLLAVGLYFWGGLPMLMWGFFLSTTLLWHGTFTINSLSHVFGRRRYKTSDTSRNNFLLALITCGEGWHNNHHYHQNTANQGWFWWEVDISFYVLKVLSWLGVVSGLRMPSEAVKYAYLRYTPEERAQLRGAFQPLSATVPDGA